MNAPPIAYALTRAQGGRRRKEFEEWCHRHRCGRPAETLGRDRERRVRSYRYPEEHRRHLRATNVVASPFVGLRLQTDAAKLFKKVQWATAVIWKMLMPTRRRSRRLNAPQLLAKVCA